MNTIPSITRSGYPVPPVKHTASAEKASKTNTDIFTSDASQEKYLVGTCRESCRRSRLRYCPNNMICITWIATSFPGCWQNCGIPV